LNEAAVVSFACAPVIVAFVRDDFADLEILPLLVQFFFLEVFDAALVHVGYPSVAVPDHGVFKAAAGTLSHGNHFIAAL